MHYSCPGHQTLLLIAKNEQKAAIGQKTKNRPKYGRFGLFGPVFLKMSAVYPLKHLLSMISYSYRLSICPQIRRSRLTPCLSMCLCLLGPAYSSNAKVMQVNYSSSTHPVLIQFSSKFFLNDKRPRFFRSTGRILCLTRLTQWVYIYKHQIGTELKKMTNSNDIKKTRQTLNLTINDMAAACGVHRQTLIKWERGERQPDKAAARLIDVLVWIAKNGKLESYLKTFVKKETLRRRQPTKGKPKTPHQRKESKK